MTLEKTLVISASIFAMLCMPLLATDNLVAKPRGVEPQAVEKIADEVKAAKAKIEKLKKNFNISTDTFTNVKSYTHKRAKLWVGIYWSKFPVPIIIGDHLVLLINLNQNIQPKTIIIKIADMVTTYDIELIRTDFIGNHYLNRYLPNDQLFRYIASHAREIKSNGINIRYSGSDNYMDRYSDSKSRWAIRKENEIMLEFIIETLELYDALQILKKDS